MWSRQKTKVRVNLWMFHIGILFPREGKRWSEDLPTGKGTRKGQQSTGQCRPNLQPNIKTNFPKDCLDKWTKLTTDQDILDIVSGDQLDFVEIPHQQKLPTPFKLSKEEERLVDLEVQKLLMKGTTEVVEPCKNQFLPNIFTMPKKGGGRRHRYIYIYIVIDMRDLNSFIEPVNFKM